MGGQGIHVPYSSWLLHTHPTHIPTHTPTSSPLLIPQTTANKRGKVASRPGQLSRKDLEKRAQLQQEIEQQTATTSSSGRPSPSQAPEDAVVPEVVTNRMLKRIVLFMGVPVFTGMLLLPGFYYLKVVQGWDVPTYVVYTIQSFTFGAGMGGCLGVDAVRCVLDTVTPRVSSPHPCAHIHA